jgi:hypothetical protein
MVCLAILLPAQTYASPVRCGDTYKGHHRRNYELFDGPPKNLAYLIPESFGWTISEPDRGGFYLACYYRGLKNPIVLSIPKGIRACLFDKHGVTCQ